VVAVGAPHHVTQRGNNRQKTFFHDSDCRFYLALLADQSRRYGLGILGYCLMPRGGPRGGAKRDIHDKE
jgi:putative transposase